MTTLSAKAVALTAVIVLGSLMSTSAHAAILRSTNGNPVLTSEGNCVITGWEGSEGCEAAKAAAGMGNGEAIANPAPATYDHEKVVYFDFNKSSLTPQAKHRLDELAKKIKWVCKRDHSEESIKIVGYADRLGNAKHNEALAKKRAETVRAYLVQRGVKAKKIEVRALGAADSKTNCPANLPHKKLIGCLREDRRVEVEFGSK